MLLTVQTDILAAEELRLGNFIHAHFQAARVTGISSKGLEIIKQHSIEFEVLPIKACQFIKVISGAIDRIGISKILINSGFVIEGKRFIKTLKDGSRLFLKPDYFDECMNLNYHGMGMQVHHLHTLQNIYYLITGTELEPLWQH